jgi:heme/copper-type cytochrome/quinol oxidase subunit 1
LPSPIVAGVVGGALSIGAAGMMVFAANMIAALVRKQAAGENPWGAGATTLEWTLPSPPPFHQFDTLPRIESPSLEPQPEPIPALHEARDHSRP